MPKTKLVGAVEVSNFLIFQLLPEKCGKLRRFEIYKRFSTAPAPILGAVL